MLPRWNGEGLDYVVDFVTYVFVPAYAIAASGYLPEMLAIPLAALIVVTGALYFADGNMKTDDNYFRGFPAVWNLIAFYIFVLAPPPWAGAPSRRRACRADLRTGPFRSSAARQAFAGPSTSL